MPELPGAPFANPEPGRPRSTRSTVWMVNASSGDLPQATSQLVRERSTFNAALDEQLSPARATKHQDSPKTMNGCT